MQIDELNEVATLLHCKSEIATNHPDMVGIGRACHKRLAEINAKFLEEEKKAAEATKAEAAKKAAANFKPSKPGDPGYVESEKAPVKAELSDPHVGNTESGSNANVEVERRV